MPRLFAAAAALILSLSSHAAIITIDATARGFLPDTGGGNTATGTANYIAAFCFDINCSTPSPNEYRNYFTFDIPSLSGPVTAIEFLINAGDISAAESYQVTQFSVLSFANLGTGIILGTHDFVPGEAGTDVSIALNAAAIAAITPNSQFFLGGRVTTLAGGSANEYIFGSTGGVGAVTQLKITTLDSGTAVPEPSSFFLLFAGIFLLASGHREQRTAPQSPCPETRPDPTSHRQPRGRR